MRQEDVGRYDVVLTHPAGVALSTAAEVRVGPRPVVVRAPLSYQWRLNGVPIAGATQSNYALSNVTVADEGVYDAMVTNPAGAAVSEAAHVGVNVSLAILRQPVGAAVRKGSAVTLSVLAKGPGTLAYQSYKWPAPGNGVPVPGGTLATLGFASVSPTEGGTYSVEVSGRGIGIGAPVSTDRVVVSVSTTRGVTVLAQPHDVAMAEGGMAVVRTAVDAGDSDVVETRYTLCALQNGVPVATSTRGSVPADGVLNVPLREVNAGGAYGVSSTGPTATADRQPPSASRFLWQSPGKARRRGPMRACF